MRISRIFLSQHMMGKFFALVSLSSLPNLYQHSHNYPAEIFCNICISTWTTEQSQLLAVYSKLDNSIRAEKISFIKSIYRQEGDASVALRRLRDTVGECSDILTHSLQPQKPSTLPHRNLLNVQHWIVLALY